MIDETTARIGAGYDVIMFGVINDNGYLIGNTAGGAAAGAKTGEAMLRLEGARTIPFEIGEDETLTVQGDNQALVQFSWENADLPAGVFEMSVKDLDYEALAQGSKVQPIGDIKVGVLMPSDVSQPDQCLLIQRKAKTWASGSRGTSVWEGFLILRTPVRPLGVTVTQREFNPYRYAITTSKGDRLPWGATLSEALHGTTKAPIIPFDSPNPIHIHSFQGNGAEDDFTVLYTPVSDAKARVYANGVQQNGWTRAGKVFTLSSPAASAAIVNILYEFDEGEL